MRVYNVAARPIVENVLKGYNGTIFAYGQTGTGKTFTMTGDLERAESQGIIPNSFAHIFDHIAKCQQDKTFLVRVSYLEIYNEELRDLLAKDGHGLNLEIKEKADVGVYVKNLISIIVGSASQMQKLMEFGNKNREFFTAFAGIMAEHGMVTQGKLHLVDLAGSERQSKTGAAGERLKEAAKINLSLSTLGNVISALVDVKSTHIPYREFSVFFIYLSAIIYFRNSKLTRLLQDSLGGNSKTIANIGPASYNYDETLSTLRYANRAKNIQNVARINEDPKDAQLRKAIHIAFYKQYFEIYVIINHKFRRYSSLQEEAAAKTRRLRRVWSELCEVRTELTDSEAEHQREVEGLLESIRQLRKVRLDLE
ncbi:unnamed protein product [Strongylus vulgaris]|uniref:Kinesin-like protein n=1 Tax=Strongylus vulgaris TaxID=40348 RepID=A0A3P7IRN2_STRVU|nr:unnamed protein product [Strongylus vulgaris]